MKLDLAYLVLLAFTVVPCSAQSELSLDSCRSLALRNNKALSVLRLKQQIACNMVKAARTKYLPKVDAVGGYMFTSKEISLLNDKQKSSLTNIGTATSTQLGGEITSFITGLAQQGILTPEQAQHLGSMFNRVGTSLGEALNHSGQRIVDAFDTDTKNVFMGSVMVKQPIYMGGAITAANKIARINKELAANDTEAGIQSTIYKIDQAYWTVVSLKHKQKLANSFLGLVSKLDGDVKHMIKEGVATRADGLKVAVKKNEAEMTLTQADNGLSLARMLLNQLCGLPLDTTVTLADEDKENLALEDIGMQSCHDSISADNRPELRMLHNAVDISRQATNITRAAYLPQVALTAGYMVTNPNIYNGFQNRFSGVWNVGVMVRIPIWSWFEGSYKIRANRITTNIATLQLDDTREKIELQINQSSFKVNEASKRLALAKKNVENAEENLRCANLGFKEGVMQTTDVMEAQTAWLQAQSQKIDAEIDVKLSQVNLKKALGILQ